LAGFSALAGLATFSAFTGAAGFAIDLTGVLGLGLAAGLTVAFGAALGAAFAATLTATLAATFTGALATGFSADLATGFAAGFAFDTGFAGALLTGLVTGLVTGLETDLATGLAAGLEASLGAAFFSTGLALTTTFVTVVLTALAGAGLPCFFPGAAGLALAAVFTLAGVLVFFTAVFELVLRGFFTSCLLAVAAYASFRDTSHLQMNCGHRLICVKTHIFDLLGASGLKLRDPVRALIVATEQP